MVSPADFTCSFLCTRADIRQVGVHTYLHCMSRHRDLQQEQMSKSTVAQSMESKGPAVMVILCRLTVFTCGFWSTLADMQHEGLHTYKHCTFRVRDLQQVLTSKSMVVGGRGSLVHTSQCGTE